MPECYTLCSRDNEGVYSVVATGLSARRAAMAIVENGGEWQPALGMTEHRTTDTPFRSFTLRRHNLRNWTTDRYVITATVPMTGDAAADEEAAWPIIEAQILADPKMYCKLTVFADSKWAEHLLRKAERARVVDLDRLIIAGLITALVDDGWTICGNTLDDDPALERSTDVDKIVDEFTGYDMVEFVARRGADRAWARLILGESGWDVVQDYSVSIESYVDAVTAPYLPTDSLEGFADVYILPAPETASAAAVERAITGLVRGLRCSFGD